MYLKYTVFLKPFLCIHSHLREPVFVHCFCKSGFSLFWEFQCKHWLLETEPAKLQTFFCSTSEIFTILFFNSLFTSPIVSLWGRKIRQCLSWLTAQYEQWRDSFPTIQSLKSVILRSESWKINQWEEIFYRMWLLYCCSLQWMSDLQAPQITLRIAPYFHALLGSEITKERN